MGNRAIYPGSFDPVTYGHLDLIERATQVFDEVVVAVAVNSRKRLLFDAEERRRMLEEALQGKPRVEIVTFDGLVVELARKRGIRVLIRGLRMLSDFEYEFQMALTNRRLADDVETVFLMPSENYSFISSTLLKEAAVLGADLRSFVPERVARRLRERLEGSHADPSA